MFVEVLAKQLSVKPVEESVLRWLAVQLWVKTLAPWVQGRLVLELTVEELVLGWLAVQLWVKSLAPSVLGRLALELKVEESALSVLG